MQHDRVRPSEERIRYLDLKVLRIIATRLYTFPFRRSVSPRICHLKRAFLLPLLLVLLQDLIPRLLQFIIAIVEHLGELERHLGVALAGEGVQDLGQFGLANDCVLDFADLLVAKDDVSLVNAQLERQEKDLDSAILVALLDFQLLLLYVEGFWDAKGSLATTSRCQSLLLLAGLPRFTATS